MSHNTIDINSRIGAMRAALSLVERGADEAGRVKVSSIKSESLRALANSIASGWSDSIDVGKLKGALKLLDAEAKAADTNGDRSIDASERPGLSLLATRLLAVASTPVPSPSTPVSSGCGTSAPRPPVSSGCGTSAPRPVSTSCGTSAPISRPVRSGC